MFLAKKFEKRMKISFLLGESENMKATGIVRRIDDLGSVVNQGVSAPIRTPEVEYAPLFRVRVAGDLTPPAFSTSR